MYESFYGLKEKPFNLLPDPDYLYMSQEHENVYTHLEYALAENKGFAIITGEIGSGKTTLINFLLNKIQQDINVGLINNTYLSPSQFLRMICQEYELSVNGGAKAEMLDLIHGFLLDQFAKRKRVVLIVDEAQNLTTKTMEEIRMLSNLEAEKRHLIQLVLVGQPELIKKLQRKDLEQIAQRVIVHCHLNALKKDEVREFIKYRLKVGGTENLDIFDQSAVDVIYNYSRGIPRLINILCDTAFVYAYADELKVIDKKIIETVINAREAGGLLSCPHSHEEKALSKFPPGTLIPESFEDRLRLLEQKVGRIENMVGSLDQRIKTVTNNREGRDKIVLELVRMLKESLENRFYTLSKLHTLKFNRQQTKQDSTD